VRVAVSNHDLDSNQSLSKLHKIEFLTDSLKDEVLQIKLIDQLALAHLRLGDSINFNRTNDRLLEYEDIPKAAKGTVWRYYNINKTLREEGRLAEAYRNMREGFERVQALELSEDDKIYKVRMLFVVALIEERARRYEQAEATLIECIKLLNTNDFDDEKENHLYGKVYSLLGSTDLGRKNYTKAQLNFDKALHYGQLLRNSEDRTLRQMVYWLNLAALYILKKDYDSALEQYTLLMSKFEDLSSHRGKINTLVGYASSGYLSHSIPFKEAEQHLIRAKQYALDNFPTHVPWVDYNWALILKDNGQLTDAVDKMASAYQLAKQFENTDREIEALRFLSVNAVKNNAQYSEAYADLIEKSWKEERALQRRFAEVEYRTEEAKADAAQQRGLLAEKTLENERTERAKQIWLGISLALLLLGFGGFVIISQRSKNKELLWEKQQQVANEEIYKLMLGHRAKLEEGKKIAEKSISEEIHDGILGEMLGIRLILSGLNESSDEAAVQKRQELIEQLQGLEEELRSISHQLNASAYNKVNEFGLALEELLNTNCKPVGLQYTYTYTSEYNWDQLPGEVKIQLYRMVQSGLKNTIKHAKASNVDVRMVADKHQISLEIKDNGIGFDLNEERKGIGLKNLRSRIQKINGTLEIRSAPRKGTVLHISIPHKYLVAEAKSSTTQTA
jgi:signal transduction histidine kinase